MPVPEPVIHESSRLWDAERAQRKTPTPKGDPEARGSVDPLRAFEIDSRHLYPELQQWMNGTVEERLIRVEQIASRPTAHRDLNYIIWRETQRGVGNKAVGSSEVVGKACRRLFNIPDPKVEKK